jgi:hypothetical protein
MTGGSLVELGLEFGIFDFLPFLRDVFYRRLRHLVVFFVCVLLNTHIFIQSILSSSLVIE